MSANFKIIAITAPDTIPCEATRITAILRNGEADTVHIRKPDWDISSMRRLICAIPGELHARLRLHSHFELAGEFSLGGIHLNSRNPVAPEGISNISISFHSVEQLADAAHYEYVTLSPVFDSISKPGYHAAFDLDALRPLIEGKNVVALGGVTPGRFPLLREAGFAGAAMLGYFWKQYK